MKLGLYDNPAKYACKCVIWPGPYYHWGAYNISQCVLHTSKRVRITYSMVVL